MKRTTIMLPHDLADQVKNLKADGETSSGFIRAAIARHVDHVRAERFRQKARQVWSRGTEGGTWAAAPSEILWDPTHGINADHFVGSLRDQGASDDEIFSAIDSLLPAITDATTGRERT